MTKAQRLTFILSTFNLMKSVAQGDRARTIKP
jgi:hypothetical protein